MFAINGQQDDDSDDSNHSDDSMEGEDFADEQ